MARITVTAPDGEELRVIEHADLNEIGQYDAIGISKRCRECNHDDPAVRGLVPHHDDRGVSSLAHCLWCGAEVGKIRVNYDTVFGREEDLAMLVNGRPRVYGAKAERGR